MITELAGYTLTRAIPDHILAGVINGTYKVFGGVIRNESGQIVAHLVNSGASLSSVSSFASPINNAFSVMNTYQLHKIGTDITQLLSLAKATMVMSGLTLAVTSAGFLFLSNKLNKIDEHLLALSTDVKSIKSFLELHERAKLITALRVIKELNKIDDITIKTQMLINSRQTLGEIHEKYKSLLLSDEGINELMAAEEYFTITAIGHSLCSAELGMFDQAKIDLLETQTVWRKAVKSFVRQKVIGKDPQRFLTKNYVEHIKSYEIASWMDFAEDTDFGIERLDDLRGMSPMLEFNIFNSIDKKESIAIDVGRKLVQRDKVLQGYVDQYAYFSTLRMKPSEVQQYFDGLPVENKVEDCYIFLANDHLIPLCKI